MSGVDLEALRRSDAPAAAAGRPLASRLVLPAVLLAGAAAAWFFLQPVLIPAKPVRTAAVRVTTAVGRSTAVVEATGWVEPEPFPTYVRPLVDGVVASVDVLEGRPVEAGKTVLGRLESAVLRAAVERGEATVKQREAALLEAQAELSEAEALRVQRLDLRNEVARMEGEVRLSRAEKITSEAEVSESAQALEGARAELDAQEEITRRGSGTPLLLAKARAAVAEAEAAVRGKRSAVERASAAVATAEALLALAKEGLERPEALEAAVRKGQARVAAATAERDLAIVERDIAAREHGLLTVMAPVDGVVLRLETAPGSVIGPSAMPRAGEEGAGLGMGSLVSLYDPKRLQARIDVPLSTVAGVGVGQKAELVVEALREKTFHGTVIRVQSEADVLKNTLQVKVRILDPDPLLRPEMLARARFLPMDLAAVDVAATAAKPSDAPTPARILVPKEALRGDAVFVVDPRRGGRARRVAVTKVAEEGEWVEVRGDLSSTHQVILDPVDDGQRVEVASR